METKIEELGACKKKINIEVSKEEINAELEKEFAKIKSSATIPGFRKGKAPRQLLQKRFGKQIEEEVKQNIITNSYQEAIEENKLTPLGTPEFGEINFDINKPLIFDITMEVKPEFETKDYKGLKVSKKKIKITDKMVDAELKRLSMQKAQLVAVKSGSIKKDDLIICNSKIEVDGNVVIEDDNNEVFLPNQVVSNVKVPDLEKSLVGTKVGDETSINVKLDDNFRIAEHKGKDAELKILVNDIKRPKAPTIDDEFAKQFGSDTLEDLKDKIEFELETQLKTFVEHDVNNRITEKLCEQTKFDLPDGIVSSMAEDMVERYKAELLQSGRPLEEVQDIEKKVKEESEESAIKKLKLAFILEDIANKEKIYVTDTEVDKKITELARSYNLTPQKMFDYLEKEGNIRSLRLQMREEKTIAFVVKEAEITEDEKAIGEESEENKTETQESS
ncbi:MAG: trigger factor [Candidatus Anammoxibacter sp.]